MFNKYMRKLCQNPVTNFNYNNLPTPASSSLDESTFNSSAKCKSAFIPPVSNYDYNILPTPSTTPASSVDGSVWRSPIHNQYFNQPMVSCNYFDQSQLYKSYPTVINNTNASVNIPSQTIFLGDSELSTEVPAQDSTINTTLIDFGDLDTTTTDSVDCLNPTGDFNIDAFVQSITNCAAFDQLTRNEDDASCSDVAIPSTAVNYNHDISAKELVNIINSLDFSIQATNTEMIDDDFVSSLPTPLTSSSPTPSDSSSISSFVDIPSDSDDDENGMDFFDVEANLYEDMTFDEAIFSFAGLNNSEDSNCPVAGTCFEVSSKEEAQAICRKKINEISNRTNNASSSDDTVAAVLPEQIATTSLDLDNVDSVCSNAENIVCLSQIQSYFYQNLRDNIINAYNYHENSHKQQQHTSNQSYCLPAITYTDNSTAATTDGNTNVSFCDTPSATISGANAVLSSVCFNSSSAPVAAQPPSQPSIIFKHPVLSPCAIDVNGLTEIPAPRAKPVSIDSFVKSPAIPVSNSFFNMDSETLLTSDPVTNVLRPASVQPIQPMLIECDEDCAVRFSDSMDSDSDDADKYIIEIPKKSLKKRGPKKQPSNTTKDKPKTDFVVPTQTLDGKRLPHPKDFKIFCLYAMREAKPLGNDSSTVHNSGKYTKMKDSYDEHFWFSFRNRITHADSKTRLLKDYTSVEIVQVWHGVDAQAYKELMQMLKTKKIYSKRNFIRSKSIICRENLLSLIRPHFDYLESNYNYLKKNKAI